MASNVALAAPPEQAIDAALEQGTGTDETHQLSDTAVGSPDLREAGLDLVEELRNEQAARTAEPEATPDTGQEQNVSTEQALEAERDRPLTPEEREIASQVLTEAHQLARERGLNAQKRATGADYERVQSLEDQLEEKGIDVDLERLQSDPEFAELLEQANSRGVSEGREMWNEANEAEAALYKAMKGWGTDEAAIFTALEGKTPEEIQAIRDAFEANRGEDLDEWLDSELSGSDQERADQLMKGDPTLAAAAELYWAMKGAGTDEAAIHRILAREDAAEIVEIFNDQYAEKYGADDLQDALESELSSDHLKQAESLLELATNESMTEEERADMQAKADAAEIHRAMKGGWFFGAGTDEAAIYQVLGRNLDAGELTRLQETYESEYEESLKLDLEGELSFNQEDRAISLLEGDKVGADVAALRSAEWGWGVDRDEVRSVLEGTDQEHRDAVLSRYEREEEQSFHDSVEGQVSDDALTVIDSLIDDGKLSVAEELIDAMDGAGTDEEQLKEMLDGKTKEELAEIRAEYLELTGRGLDNDIDWEVSGDDQFDLTESLRGKPETLQEIYDAMERRYEYERSGWDWGVDAFGNQGEVLDRQMELARERMERIENGTATAEDMEDLRNQYEVHQIQAQAFREAKDAVVDTAAMVGTVIVATGTIIATGGTAAGVWLAVGAAAATRVGTKVLLKGGRYDWGGEFATDVGIAALEAGTAKLGMVVTKGLSKVKFMANLGSKGLRGRAAVAGIDGLADGSASGLVSGLGEGALTTDFSGMSLGQAIETLGARGGIGAIGGGVGGGALSAGLTGGMGKVFSGNAGRAASETAESATDSIAREGSETVTEQATGEGVDQVIDESIEAGVESSVKRTTTETVEESTEEATEATVKEATEEATEQSGRDRTGQEPEEALEQQVREGVEETIDATTRRISPEREQAEAIARKIEEQIERLKPAEVEAMLRDIPGVSPEQAATAMDFLTEVGGFDNLGNFARRMSDLAEEGYILYTARGKNPLLDTLSYLSDKNYWGDLVQIPKSTNISKKAMIVLDEATVSMFEQNPRLAERIFSGDLDVKLIHPLGFEEGVDAINYAAGDQLSRRISQLVTDSADETTEAFEQTLQRRLRERLENIDSRFADTPVEHIRPERATDIADSAVERSTRRLNGQQQVTVEQVEAALEQVPEEMRSLVRDAMEQMVDVRSWEQMGGLCQKMHREIMEAIPEGINPQNVVYITPMKRGQKSYHLMNDVYRRANDLPAEQFIELKGLKKYIESNGLKQEDMVVVVLDDMAGTGRTIRTDAVDLVRHSGAKKSYDYTGEIILAPMVATRQVADSTPRMISNGKLPNVQMVIGDTVDEFVQVGGRHAHPFVEALPEAQRRLLTSALGGIEHIGYDEQGGLMIAFPYMSPNNNNLFFSDFLERLGKGLTSAPKPPSPKAPSYADYISSLGSS